MKAAKTKKKATNKKYSVHPRNKYFENQPDFAALSLRYKSFATHVKDNGKHCSIDFKNPESVKCLNQTLLLHDFNIKWDMPTTNLCPPIPGRCDYVHWVEDLLKDREKCTSFTPHPEGKVRGVDVGTGSSVIFPLLALALHRDENWSFVASDIDPISVDWAKKNVQANDFSDRIDVRLVKQSCSLLGLIGGDDGVFDFTMCNPPFFSSTQEAEEKKNPKNNRKATSYELVCEGGEEAFVEKMVRDSLVLKKKVWWYTSMIGKKGTLKRLLRLLRENNVHTETTFFQQGKTRRWR